MPNAKLAKAKLIPMNGDQPETDEEKHIEVQFNPASLKVTLSNSLKADNKGGNQSAAAQFVDKSESTLAIELYFDTSVEEAERIDVGGGNQERFHSDVRALTRRIAVEFMQPQNPESDKPGPPKRCRFQWGSFAFVGMLSTYNETLDFFSASGIPLRAKLSLTFKEDRFQFDLIDLKQQARNQATSTTGGDGVSAAQATEDAGRDPREWRDTALFNGMEDPRTSDPNGVAIPPQSSGDGTSDLRGGNSDQVGTGVPGAFPNVHA